MEIWIYDVYASIARLLREQNIWLILLEHSAVIWWTT